MPSKGILKAFQDLFKRPFSRRSFFEGVCDAFQGRFKGLLRVFQGPFKGLQGPFKGFAIQGVFRALPEAAISHQG